MEPIRYQCNATVIGTVFSLRGILMLSVLCAVLYFGWPIIEAVILLLPIPDPIHLT